MFLNPADRRESSTAKYFFSENGVSPFGIMLILGCGSNTVRFRPALNVPLDDLQLGIEISRKAAKEVFKK